MTNGYQRTIIPYIILDLREFVLNSRHPGPRRAWEVGFEPPFLTPLPSLPSLRSLPLRDVASAENADLAIIYHTNAIARSPNQACLSIGLPNGPLGPKALHMDPKGVPR